MNNTNLLNIDFNDIDSFQLSNDDYNYLQNINNNLYSFLYNELLVNKNLDNSIKKIILYSLHLKLNNDAKIILSKPLISTLETDPFTPTKRIKKVPFQYISAYNFESIEHDWYHLTSKSYLSIDKFKNPIRCTVQFNIYTNNRYDDTVLYFYVNISESDYLIKRIELATFSGYSQQNITVLYTTT
ncbi:hypothetical protein [Mycoplasma sp. P36-A1]|uniref:hypothetical protein n=1 Tax=Mycoplasma sp. P36-A1 TaxID=3252900 RepID=UPI003C2EB8A2